MKKTMIFAAVAALVSLASCQKEDITDNKTDQKISPVFTASIAGSTKTTVDLSDGKVAWEADDEITVTDASTASAVYAIESIDATTGKATFVIKDEETALGDGPYTATYGTEPATAQTYSATAGKLYMTAPATTTNSFEFTVQCGLMKLNLTKTGESVKSIAVTSSTDATYTLTCDPAESIAAAKDFCIALPAGSYTKIEITNSSDAKATLNSTSGVEVAANHIKPVTFGESKLNFAPAAPEPLPGKFKVDITGKEVSFSKGNLRYTVATGEWSFFDNQYDCGPSGYSSGHNSEISLFTWGYNATKSIVPGGYASDNVSRTSGNLTQEEDWGSQIGDGSTWRTLTQSEWQYLFSRYSYKYGVAVCGKNNCVVIAPEGFAGTIATSYDASAWAEAEAAGLVCLPAAGNRLDGSQVISVGNYGSYWTSTATFNKATHAVCLGFDPYEGVIFSDGHRDDGCAVRLVKEYSTAPATTGTAKATIGGNSVDVKWIQLWENGPKFAEYNVGTTSEKKYGAYFEWGENIASSEWGDNWRMPTADEYQALLDKCTRQSDEVNGVKGLLFKGEQGTAYESNTVFFPAGGSNNGEGGLNNTCNYWTSTLSTDNSDKARLLYYDLFNSYYLVDGDWKVNRYSVRAVLAE